MSEPSGRAAARRRSATGLSTESVQAGSRRQPDVPQARYPAIATTQNWYIALAHSVRDRMLERWVNTVKTYAARDVKVACYLLGRVPDRPAARQQPDVPRHRGRRARGHRRARPGPRRAARARGRAGPRQWRSRPARGVLSRLARDARDYRRSAMAFATSSASSIRRSATAGRSRPPTSGCARAIPGRSRGPRSAGT